MGAWIIKQRIDLARASIEAERAAAPLLVQGDAAAHEWRVEVLSGGEAADLSGYAAGAYFERSDGVTVAVGGTIADNVVSVVLESPVYNYAGAVKATLDLTQGSERITIAAVTLYVRQRDDGVVLAVDPSAEFIRGQKGLENAVAALQTRETSLASQLGTLAARVEGIEALPDGSTTADAELRDIRVGADNVTYASAGTAVRMQLDDIKTSIAETAESMSAMIGTEAVIIREAQVNGNGTIEYSRLWNMLCIKAEAGYMFREIRIGTASERVCYAFYGDQPVLGSVAVDGRRYLTSVGTYSVANRRMPAGAAWLAIRYAQGDFPSVDSGSKRLDAAFLAAAQDLPDVYAQFAGKQGVLTDAADSEVLSVTSTYLVSGDLVRVHGKNMFEFQQSWDQLDRENVRFTVDRVAGSINVKTTGEAQDEDLNSKANDSTDHIVAGQSGNLHCLCSFRFQADTVVTISSNPSKPINYRDNCMLMVTDGTADSSHTIYDYGSSITMIARANINYGVLIAVVVNDKTGPFESDEGITFYPQIEVGAAATPFELHKGMDVEYTGTDIAAQLRTYAPVTTIVVESEASGGIICYYRKATVAKQAEAASAAAKRLATLAELHKHSKYRPGVTFIDDDTTRLDSVQRYHDLMDSLGVVGNYACIATNIEEHEGMAELLRGYEDEGFGMLFHCDLQRGTETEYFLPDSRRDIGKCRKNVLDGLRKMPGFGLNNYLHWVTPYGVNDKDIQEIARQAGLDCIITTATHNFAGNNAAADRYNLPRMSLTINANVARTVQRIKDVVDVVKATSGWLMITTHAYEWPAYVAGGTNVAEEAVAELVAYIRSVGVDITSFQEAWERRRPMYLLAEAFKNL